MTLKIMTLCNILFFAKFADPGKKVRSRMKIKNSLRKLNNTIFHEIKWSKDLYSIKYYINLIIY
jgi:hypothetical protein